MLRDPDRHDGYTLQIRQIGTQIADRLFQMFAVVDALAEHDLPVHRDPCIVKPFHLFECFAGKPVVQHLTAQFRFRGLKRDIDR